jgi:16S rRNA (guanine966-N2)-methyltransferase
MSRNHRSAGHNAPQKTRGRRAGAGRSEVRIVGGRWRGRKVRFPDLPGLRPSPDRVRETLFNWLAPVVQGARVLDLFAGSGVLGLEALSRGAASAVLVERDPAAARQLRDSAAALGADSAGVVEGDALAWLDPARGPFDIVFLDPPFGTGLQERALVGLDRPGVLSPGAYVYLERPVADGPPALPAGWILHRSGRAGDVGYYLAIAREAGAAGEAPDLPSSGPDGEGP